MSRGFIIQRGIMSVANCKSKRPKVVVVTDDQWLKADDTWLMASCDLT